MYPHPIAPKKQVTHKIGPPYPSTWWALFFILTYMLTEKHVEALIADSEQYSTYLYTNWRNITQILEERQTDTALQEYVASQFPEGLPKFFNNGPVMVYFRNVATPNFETYRFMICADVLDKLRPLIFEYTADKFVDINELKRGLGKMVFYKRLDKNLDPIILHKTIIDMSKWNGKRINEIMTLDDTSFVEYHRTLFYEQFPHMRGSVHDVSEWLTANGTLTAKKWYKKFLTLFLTRGALFENFMTSDKDLKLTRDAVLPAIMEIERECGYKPLIVALEPTSIEGDAFWHSYPAVPHVDS